MVCQIGRGSSRLYSTVCRKGHSVSRTNVVQNRFFRGKIPSLAEMGKMGALVGGGVGGGYACVKTIIGDKIKPKDSTYFKIEKVVGGTVVGGLLIGGITGIFMRTLPLSILAIPGFYLLTMVEDN